jgi:hypothetical protein
MKKSFFIFTLLIVSNPLFAESWFLKTDDCKPVFAQWDFKGQHIFTEVEKQGLINQGSGVESDFIDIAPSTTTLKLADDIYNEGIDCSRSQLTKELIKRESK